MTVDKLIHDSREVESIQLLSLLLTVSYTTYDSRQVDKLLTGS